MWWMKVSDSPSLDDEWDPLIDRPWRRTYAWVRTAVWTVGLMTVVLLAWLLQGYDVATYFWAGLSLVLFWSGLKSDFKTLRHDKMMRLAYYEMSDVHRAFVQYARDAVLHADEDMLEVIEGEAPRLFWEQLVDRRLLEMREAGISDRDPGTRMITFAKYESPYSEFPSWSAPR